MLSFTTGYVTHSTRFRCSCCPPPTPMLMLSSYAMVAVTAPHQNGAPDVAHLNGHSVLHRRAVARRITPSARTLWRQGGLLQFVRFCRNHDTHARSSPILTRCQREKLKLRLRLDHQVQFGEHHALFGSAESTGSWQDRVGMIWTADGWVADIEATVGEAFEFKYVTVSSDGQVIWERGPNRTLELPSQSGDFEVVSHWNQTQERIAFVARSSGAQEVTCDVSRNSDLRHTENSPDVGNGGFTSGQYVESTPFVQGWQGKETLFMKSNEHSGERLGQWDSMGLEAAAVKVVDGDRTASNWWRKLEVVRDLVASQTDGTDRLDALVYCAIYLKWINSGQIQCLEDGGHHRPNKHAEISRLIFKELERIVADKSATAKELIVARKMNPFLPAFKAEFTAAVPLTRIRDIAHRNDIPHDLKLEIKHTIQNKLHRNAGPEDLVATEALLNRVLRNREEYSAAFLEQLKIFYKELKDFFNAGSLTEQLEGVRPSLDEHQSSILEEFLHRKKKLDEDGRSMTDNNTAGDNNSLLGTLHALTGLRTDLLRGLESGLRNDASDDSIAMRQKWRLSEIGLEDYSFVLLSRFINTLGTEGGASGLVSEAKSGNVAAWNHSLDAIVLGIRQLRLSRFQPAECLAIENELLMWQTSGVPQVAGSDDAIRVWALRLKATLNRARRLAESFSDTILHLFPNRVEKLGAALGIPVNAIRTFAEAEIRASVVFQLAKLCSLLLKAIRQLTGDLGWDTLMPGLVHGTLVEVDHIVPGSVPLSVEGPLVLLVKEADGDEEVKAAGQNIVAVILQHELPHLSHLGVRARQEKVVFITCDDEENICKLRNFCGHHVRVEATADHVHVSPHSKPVGPDIDVIGVAEDNAHETVAGRDAGVLKNDSSATNFVPVKLSKAVVVLELPNAVMETAGAKATYSAKLAALAQQSLRVFSDQGVPATFKVPRGKVLPFGCMEEALSSSGKLRQFKELLDHVETVQLEGGELDKICNELKELISEQRIPVSVIRNIAGGFAADSRLFVRSSANVEDLAGMSGAGLYNSIPNVMATEEGTFGQAIAEVWASLYTRRAVLSRRMAGVKQSAAAMAILIQEMLMGEISFVLHTVSPINRNARVVQAELAAGLGETLASGTKGTPWRLECNKFDGSVKVLAFANFSEELYVQSGGVADGKVLCRTVDYSKSRLSINADYMRHIGQRLATIGFFLEQKCGVPQDIEGCVVDNDIYIVQARPQP